MVILSGCWNDQKKKHFFLRIQKEIKDFCNVFLKFKIDFFKKKLKFL